MTRLPALARPLHHGAPMRSPELLPCRLRRIVLRLCGAILVIVPLLPLRSIYPKARGTSALVSPEEWLLGLAIFGTMAWFLAMALHGRRGERLLESAVRRLLGLPPGRLLAGSALALLALLLSTAAFVFHGRPRLVDAVVQLFQARIFAAGLLTAPPPPGEAFFAVQHMIVDGNGWYAQYPPGHSLLLAMGVIVGPGRSPSSSPRGRA